MEKRFLEIGASERLASDFAWIVLCAESNAYYGYGIAELYNTNCVVRDYVNYYGLENIKPVIDGLGKIGWAKCSDDFEEEKKAWAEFERVFKSWSGKDEE